MVHTNKGNSSTACICEKVVQSSCCFTPRPCYRKDQQRLLAAKCGTSFLPTLCIGFAWQDFDSREAAGVTSLRRCQKLPPCPIQSVLDSSKTDTPLAKAKPINESGSTSVIIYLRTGKSCSATSTAVEEKSENM